MNNARSEADRYPPTNPEGNRSHPSWCQRVHASLPYGVAVLGPKGLILQTNPAFCSTFRIQPDDVVGIPITDVLPLLVLPVHSTETSVQRFVHTAGDEVYVRLRIVGLPECGGPTHLLLAEDASEDQRRILERQTLEERLRRSQRMEAVGRLAGGIAHDFNNMLSIIVNYAEFARRLAPDGRSRDYLDAIRKGAMRAAALTRQLLIFGRRDTSAPTAVHFNRVILEMDRMLRRILGEDVHLEMDVDPEIGHVMMAVHHAEQVLMNLAVNARDAMPRGGRLRVATRAVILDERDVKGRVGAGPGRHVCLTVEDSGVGMSEDVLALAFDPFFTTKEPGQGTGLGLSIVYGIVHEAGGFIEVRTSPGTGASFNVFLPVTNTEPEESFVETEGAPRGCGETVLVVEDEPTVRALTVQILRENGYVAWEAEHSSAALEICKNQPRPFDALLTDVIMPGMSGTELANHVKTLWPDTQVLFMSGYAADRLDTYRSQHENVLLIQKPFNGDDVLYALRRILDVAKAQP